MTYTDEKHLLNTRIRFFRKLVSKAEDRTLRVLKRGNANAVRKAEHRERLARSILLDYLWVAGQSNSRGAATRDEVLAYLRDEYSSLAEWRQKMDARGELQNPGAIDYNLGQLVEAVRDYEGARMNDQVTEA